MPKVSKIKLYLKYEWGEDYEIHYNAKGAPKFSVKGMPEDFTQVTDVYTYGFDTESDLDREIQRAVFKYRELKKTQRKVIVYKASASAELTMHRDKGEGSYCGHLPGVSKKLDSFGSGSEIASFGISYRVMMEVDHTNKKQYHPIKNDGTLGHSKTIGHREQVMDWTEEREVFFENIYSSMREMVVKMSKFIDQDAETAALLITNNQKLLG